ncbi:hypothetical protein KI387_008597, partial [Taxus chinensis]
MGDALGKFLTTDPKTDSFDHTTFVRILVDMDIIADFLATMELSVKDSIWTQNLDYEWFPFRCRSFFSLGHLAFDFQMVKKQIKGMVSWWKDFNLENLVVYGLEENDSENVAVSLKVAMEENSCEDAPSPIILANFSNNMVGNGDASSPRSSSLKQNQNTSNKDSVEILLPIHLDENVDPNSGEGWKVVNNKKKGKSASSPTKISLRSQEGFTK